MTSVMILFLFINTKTRDVFKVREFFKSQDSDLYLQCIFII